MERNRIDIIILIGWVIFMACLALPALIDKSEKIYGYTLGLLAVESISGILETNKWPFVEISGIGNVMAFVSIFSVFIKNQSLLIGIAITFAFIGINNTVYYFRGLDGEFGLGYYLWVMSYFVLASGCLAMANKNPNKVFMSFASLTGTRQKRRAP